MMRQTDYFQEFEALGEAEVQARLDRRAFDREHQVYAARWLTAAGSARFAARQRADEAAQNERDAAAAPNARLSIALGLAVIATIAALAVVLPSLTASGAVSEALRGVTSFAHKVSHAVSPNGPGLGAFPDG